MAVNVGLEYPKILVHKSYSEQATVCGVDNLSAVYQASSSWKFVTCEDCLELLALDEEGKK